MSYFDDLTEMAIVDFAGPSPRSWQAQWQNRCDCCGRFVQGNGPGVSWAQQYSETMEGPDLHDPTYRCSPCTDTHGMKGTNCNESQSKYHGRNPAPPEGGNRSGG